MKKIGLLFMVLALLLPCAACGGTDALSDTAVSAGNVSDNQQVQYQFDLKAGEPVSVADTVFEEEVTIVVDPASKRDSSMDLRSSIQFANCQFQKGITILGDYHALIDFDESCSFSDTAVITCQEATEGAAQNTTLEDNLVKISLACEGVSVKTDAAVGILSSGPSFLLNETKYAKEELAPDAAYLAVYCSYQQDTMVYTKFAVAADDSAQVLE